MFASAPHLKLWTTCQRSGCMKLASTGSNELASACACSSPAVKPSCSSWTAESDSAPTPAPMSGASPSARKAWSRALAAPAAR